MVLSFVLSGCSLSASIESSINELIGNNSFRVVPSSADVTEGGVLALTGENGEPPYHFEKVSGLGVVSSSGAFAAASTGPGDSVTVKATDKNGKIAFAVFNIVKAPEILPKVQTLSVLNKFKFSVSGGKAPYTFSVKTGGGSITPAGEYTAPASNGAVTIAVVDALGGQGEGYITVVDALQFTTPTVVMSTNSAETFATTGGVPPVLISLESGLGSFDPGTGVYSSSGVAGTSTLVARDALGNEARSQIVINSSLLINPPLIELVINSQHTFSATGGVPPYSYSLVSGSGSVTTLGVYTAPAALGTAKIRVTDSKGATSDSSVNINPELSFIFPNISLLVNETKNLSLNVIGGAPPLTYSVSSGAGTVNASTGVFIAGSAPGVYTATVVDSKGYTAQASISVQPPMTITPANATLMAGTDLSYAASGGTGPYTFSVATGGGSFVGSVYTAPNSAQTATVRATDSLGNFVTTSVTIAPVLQINPTTLSMIVSGTQTFLAAGGITPYTFKMVSGAGSIDSVTGLFTAPPAEGTAIVEVVDSQNNHAQAAITILDQVRIVPSPLSMVKKSSLTVLATGGLGPYTFSIVTGAGDIHSTSGLFDSADQAGTVTVKATDALGNSGTGTIVVYDSLTIDNAPEAIMVGETVTLAASGGAVPYVYSVTSGSGSGSIDPGTGLLTASMTPGMVTVRVTDSLNQTYDKTIEVRAALTIVPTATTLAPSNTFQFSATGGVGAYTYALVSGDGSMSTSGLYTAPASSGSAVVKVTDAGGRTASATVTINAILALSPPLSNIKYSDTQALTVAGGVSPYTYSKLSGPGLVDPSTGLFTANTTAGTSILRVTDALGNHAEATVITSAPVEITPTTKDLAFAEVFSFTALKGLPPYTFSIVSGGGVINAASGAFTAPSSSGTTTVRVTDSLNQTASATVTTYEALLISPLSASIATSQSQNISATGGVAPYVFSLMTGTGSVQTGPDRYVAAATATTAKVKVTDSLGNFSIGTINVVGPVSISPTTLTLAVNEIRTFSGLGGSTPYVFSIQSGGGTINASTGAYTAPATTGSATVRITDALNQTADATVTIIAGISLSPATVTLAVGNQQQFTPAGGVGPYTYDVQSGSGTVNSSGLFTAGGSSGSAVVRVTDSEGRTATSNVTINGALAISPATKELIFGGAQTFTASGGLGPYSYTVVVPGAGSIGLSTGAYVAPSVAGSEGVRVTDSLGNTSEAVVTVFGPVQISPTTKTLVVGEVFTFSANGGKSPYTYGVSSGGGAITGAGVYTAGSTPGSYTVRVTDALGQQSDAVVTVDPAIDLAPNTNSIRIGQTQVLTRTGGTAPFTYTVVSGGGTFNDGTMTYTPPNSLTTATVRVTDNAANTDQVTITVTAGVPAAVAYVTSAQTVQAGSCSGITTVKLQDAYSNDTTAIASTTVDFAATNLTFYSDASCSSVVTSQVIASGASQTSVYFKGTVTGLQIATASSTGLSSAMQTESITGAAETGLALSPNTLSVVAGACSSVSQLRAIDSFGNPTTPTSNRSVTLAGAGVTYFSDASCSSALSLPVSLTSGSATQDIYFKKTTIGATTVTASASGLTNGTLTLTVTAAAASKLAYITQPSPNPGSGAPFAVQPQIGIYDQYDNLVGTATNSVTLSASSTNTCSNSVGGLTVTTNPLAGTAGAVQFAGATISSVGDYYLKAEASGLSAACSNLVSVVIDYSQTVASLPGYIPHDGLAEATALIIPKLSGVDMGTGRVIEVTSSSANVTMTCAGAACAACQTPTATCVRTTDHGQGAYSFQVKSSTAETVNFTARYNDAGNLSTIATFSSVFNTVNFTAVSTATSITSAHAGLNLYFTANTGTFNATTVGVQFGDVFIRGGTVTHLASTTTLVNKLDIRVNSLTVQSGSINVNGLGYPAGYSFGATAPSLTLGTTSFQGGTHGGLGNNASNVVYGDYRDPEYPGAGGGAAAGSGGWVGHAGGGVVRIQSTKACAIASTGSIRADGAAYTGAGGSVKLDCSGFFGAIATAAITANGGNGDGTNNYRSGGGGRIALISSNGLSSFVGNFEWPNTGTKMTNATNRIQARGGVISTYIGGAGTIFLKHSGLTYGGLIVSNGGNAGPGTPLPWFQKITGTVAGQVLPMTVALPAGYNGLYKNMRLRPDISQDMGTSANLLDDNIATINSHDLSQLTVTGNISGVASAAAMRTLEVLDFLDVGRSASLSTGSDLVVLSGAFTSSPQLDLTDGVIEMTGAAQLIPAVNNTTLTTGAYSGVNFNGGNGLTVSGATLAYTGTVTANSLTVNSGSLTSVTTTIANNMTIVGGTVTTENVTIGGNLSISGGSFTHPPTSTGTHKKLNVTVAGTFTMTGGAVDVISKGYSGTYSYGPNGASTALGYGSTGYGASHGGRGYNTPGTAYYPSYGDYKDPQYPGASSSGSNQGGGVFRMTVAGLCTMNTPAKIDAGTNAGGAGGSIKLVCGGYAGTLGAAGIIANGGGNGTSGFPNGGGGRIALISTGNEASFGGNFAWPNDTTKMTNFVSRVQARGGATGGNVGGAGTIYLKHSGLTHGALIISNNSALGGITELPWLSATTGTVSGQTLPMTPSLATGYTDLYIGRKLRPNVALDNGTPNDLMDDNIVTVTSNTLSDLVVSGSLSGVASGVTFRTVEILDNLTVGEGATLKTGSDVVVLNGGLQNAPTLGFTNATYELVGAAKFFPSIPSVALSSGTFSGVNLSGGDVTVSGATLNYTGAMTTSNFTLSSGSVTSAAGSLNTGNLTITGGTYNVATTNATGNMTISGGGTNTSTTLNIGNDLTIGGSGINQFVTSNVGRDLIMSGGTNEMDNAAITRDFRMSGGTLKHRVATTTAAYRIDFSIQGLFQMTGGSINVTSLGYRAATGSGYSYSFGATAPSNSASVGSNVNSATYAAGGSHGGKGGTSNGGGILSGIVYGDYRNPRYPGGGGAISGHGGGVVNITATGSCTINTGATIIADGTATYGGAGGSIKLACGSIGGTAGSGAVRANGGTGDNAFRAGGGGGRVALIANDSFGSASFGGSFAVPTSAGTMTSFLSVVQAFGGNSTMTAPYRGGAGTIYVQHADSPNGSLIISNNGVAGSNTDMLSSVANTSLINAKVDSTNLRVTSAATPFANMVDLFVGSIIHIWPTSGGEDDPLSSTHTPFTVTSNTTNNFLATAAPFGPLTIANDHQYRFTHTFDALYVGGGAQMNLANSDLILVSGSGAACDFVSAGLNFVVPAGSAILNGNSYSSTNCPDSSFSTKGTTINFTRYCNGLGTCL